MDLIFPGIEKFRNGQNEIIADVTQQKDVLAVLPTGGGKSLCYQYPSYHLQGLVVVISPLIALMKDQVQSLQSKGLRAGALYSGQSYEEKKQIFYELSQGGQYLLYLSPERVQKPGFRTWIQSRKILLFAIDEAHCISQWGHDFREEYTQLRELKKWRPDVPVLALTASATPTVLRDIERQLGLKSPTKRVYGFYRPNLYYQVQFCEDEIEKNQYLIEALKTFSEGRVIIYCGTRKSTETLHELLSKSFAQVDYYHAGLSTEKRTQVQNDYIAERTRILIATNAFGMGIDQPDVRLVVHYQMPANIDSLYQEMGRAGRDGKESTCMLLYSKKDKGLQAYFIDSSEATSEIKSTRWDNLDALIDYCEGSECRHGEILTYYRDSQRIQRCGHCDNCAPLSERRVVLKNVTPRLTVVKSNKKKSSKELDLVLTPEQEQLFLALKAWRKTVALKKDAPAFTVLGDKSLRELAIYQPQNLMALLSIYGFGDSKIKDYGPEVLAIIQEWSSF
ncbi:MAG: RecQ family ATP-dependent DNA helicase [Bdellovibrionia bacterium]